ncbi:MAG: trehalose-phosphatase [Pseudomonadota bacterium]|nr:trehalose-phosphatase [Pseudomonadota bacterium]
MARREPKRARPPVPADDWALFLDVDGCLLDIAAHPAEVTVPGRLRDVLQGLAQRLDGALALVSGRPLAGIDALFAPLQLHGAGLHGLEWRSATISQAAPASPPALAAIHAEAEAIAAGYPGAVVEDKGPALGLHWRAAPAAMEALRGFAEAALPRLPGFRLQHGHSVVELRPAAGDKGMAIAALLQEPPFRGRVPVFAGDDITDESGFAVVNAHGGISILVGGREPSAAHFGLPSPAAVRRWLGEGSDA